MAAIRLPEKIYGGRTMIKLGIFFGGKSGEHEVSLMSAASVIRAIDREKYQPVLIGITKQGKWLLYDGTVEAIENGSWEEIWTVKACTRTANIPVIFTEKEGGITYAVDPMNVKVAK